MIIGRSFPACCPRGQANEGRYFWLRRVKQRWAAMVSYDSDPIE